jgi:hypothetical protein
MVKLFVLFGLFGFLFPLGKMNQSTTLLTLLQPLRTRIKDAISTGIDMIDGNWPMRADWAPPSESMNIYPLRDVTMTANILSGTQVHLTAIWEEP